MKVKKICTNAILNRIIFICAFTSLSLADGIFANAGVRPHFVYWKYGFMAIGMLYGLLQLYKNPPRKLIFEKETLSILVVAFLFAFITFFLSFPVGALPGSFIVEILWMILPIVYAFLILNTFSFDDIYFCVVIALFASLTGYIIYIGPANINLSNILAVSYAESFSPFESHVFEMASMNFAVFFAYYRKHKIFSILATIFAIAVFKRFNLIFAILIFILPLLVDLNKTISIKAQRLLKCGVVAFTLFYFWLVHPQTPDFFYPVFGQVRRQFTMGRSELLRRILEGDFVRRGLGSTTDFLGRQLEMDMIKIILEISIFAFLILVWFYMELAGRRLFCVIFMVFLMMRGGFQMVLNAPFTWVIAFLLIGSVNYMQPDNLPYIGNKIMTKNISFAKPTTKL